MDVSLWSLFVSAFISSTLLPGGSEVVLVYLQTQQHHDAWLLLLVASAGNTLGGMSSWLIGWWIARKFSTANLLKAEHQRAVERLKQFGSPVLLLSWLPFIGDPLCVAAGWLRVSGWQALLFIAMGKTARYAVLLALV